MHIVFLINRKDYEPVIETRVQSTGFGVQGKEWTTEGGGQTTEDRGQTTDDPASHKATQGRRRAEGVKS